MLLESDLQEMAEDYFVACVLNWLEDRFGPSRECIHRMLEQGYHFIDPNSDEADDYDDDWVCLSVYSEAGLLAFLHAMDVVEPLSEEDRMQAKDYRCRDM